MFVTIVPSAKGFGRAIAEALAKEADGETERDDE